MRHRTLDITDDIRAAAVLIAELDAYDGATTRNLSAVDKRQSGKGSWWMGNLVQVADGLGAASPLDSKFVNIRSCLGVRLMLMIIPIGVSECQGLWCQGRWQDCKQFCF
jgi:hypothetical protein